GHLYALSPAASLAWLCLSEGFTEPETTSTMARTFNINPAVAAGWVHTSTESFQRLGLVDTYQGVITATKPSTTTRQSSPLSKGPVPEEGVDYELLGTRFRLSAPNAIRDRIDSLIGNLRLDSSEENAQIFIQIRLAPSPDQWDILVNGKFVVRCEANSVAAEL